MKDNHKRLSRRTFLKRTGVVSVSAVSARNLHALIGTPKLGVATHLSAAQLSSTNPAPIPPHGAELRGMSGVLKNRLTEARFGLIFRRLPAFAPLDSLLQSLAASMHEPGDVPVAEGLTSNDNPKIPAGFTFLGQFIDHDITLDRTPFELAKDDPDGTSNFSSPSFDLRSVYGRGPADDPQFYGWNNPDGTIDNDKFRIEPNGNIDPTGDPVMDVPRHSDPADTANLGRAIIADPRNDENLIIVQLHIAFMRFHNAMVDYLRDQGYTSDLVFVSARRLVRWYYQWLMIHHYLKLVIGGPMLDQLFREYTDRPPTITTNYYKPQSTAKPYIPIEWAVAAFRFGHSQARPKYALRDVFIPLFDPNGGPDVRGGRPIPGDAVIRWSNIMPINAFDPSALPPPFRSRRIDVGLSDPLFTLPASVIPSPGPVSLAERNLLRGKRFGLPSGQQVAKAMRVKRVWTNQELGLTDPNWNGEAPLWYYILKEASLQYGGVQLGDVGGRLVGEVMMKLFQLDINSYFNQNALFKPQHPVATTDGGFTIGDLLTFPERYAASRTGARS
jgi:hypothetical protein